MLIAMIANCQTRQAKPSWPQVGQVKKIFNYVVKLAKPKTNTCSNVNTITIKKDMKVKVDISQIKYYNYYKKRYYTNKYPNKEQKNQYWSWESLFQ